MTVADLDPFDLYAIVVAALVTVIGCMFLARKALELRENGETKEAIWCGIVIALFTLFPAYVGFTSMGS